MKDRLEDYAVLIAESMLVIAFRALELAIEGLGWILRRGKPTETA